MRIPIRNRLTILYAALVAVLLAGAGAFIQIRFHSDLLNAVDEGLGSRAQSMLAEVRDPGFQVGEEGNLIDPDAAFTQIVSPDGKLIQTSNALGPRLVIPRDRIIHLTRPTFFDITLANSNEPLKARVLAARADNGFIVIAGASVEKQNEAASRLTTELLVGGLGALSITALIGWLMAGFALRPVDRMRAEAAGISGSELGRRLEVPATGDELARLATTLNDMLNRLEESIEHERRFVDDASHELRTPLGILKTELELALRKSRTPDELEETIRSAAEESNRLNSLAEDLLVLARADRGQLPVRREPTDITELLSEVVARFQPVADGRGITIEIDATVTTFAEIDPARIRQAVGNVLDNSLRNSPTGSTIKIAATADGAMLRLEVLDDGPGFDTDFLPRAFDPFARSDVGRNRSEGGTGLGLTIVRAVAEAHGGTAVASNRAGGGASVVITIPS